MGWGDICEWGGVTFVNESDIYLKKVTFVNVTYYVTTKMLDNGSPNREVKMRTVCQRFALTVDPM